MKVTIESTEQAMTSIWTKKMKNLADEKKQKTSKKYELTFTRKVAVPFDEDIIDFYRFELANCFPF